MIRRLRKGTTSVELNHKWGCDSINGESSEVELKGKCAIFRVSLKPVDSNQQEDADRFHQESDYGLKTVIIIDEQIRKKLSRFLRVHPEIEELELEIKYKQSKKYSAELEPIDNDGLRFNL